MNLNELFTRLDIEEAKEFEYFENLAELLEGDFELDSETLAELLIEIEPEVLKGLFDNYFNELQEAVPDDSSEFYLLLQSIGMQLSGLSIAINEEETANILAEEILKFKEWYLNDEDVICINEETKDSEEISVIEALNRSKLEHLTEETYEYDFSEAIDNYELDEYIMPIVPEVDEDMLEEDAYDDNDDY
jgi:hypothetical protein